jgi:hypothetical protein
VLEVMYLDRFKNNDDEECKYDEIDADEKESVAGD